MPARNLLRVLACALGRAFHGSLACEHSSGTTGGSFRAAFVEEECQASLEMRRAKSNILRVCTHRALSHPAKKAVTYQLFQKKAAAPLLGGSLRAKMPTLVVSHPPPPCLKHTQAEAGCWKVGHVRANNRRRSCRCGARRPPLFLGPVSSPS